MSEAIQPEQPPYPGAAWTEIVSRPTLEKFSFAFASDVALEASVLSRPIMGPTDLWAFFQATRAMYERDRFHSRNRHEGENVPGMGRGLRRQAGGRCHLITRDDRGAITSVRLHHRPFDQVVAFAETISRHLSRS